MILKSYMVYDTKACIFHAPFFAPGKVECERYMRRAVQELASDYREFINDYILFELGEFDNEAGVLVCHDSPQNCGPLAQFKKDEK